MPETGLQKQIQTYYVQRQKFSQGKVFESQFKYAMKKQSLPK